MGESQKKTIDEKFFNCQINYIIIGKLWHYLKKSPQDLYFELGITENKYSKIRTGACPFEFLEKRWDEQNSPLKRLGLPKEIMLGDSIIDLNGISKKDWEEYTFLRYGGDNDKNTNDNDNTSKKNKMRTFDRKLRKAFSDLDDSKTKSNIGKLYYFIKYGIALDDTVDDREMKVLQDALKKIKIGHIKACDKSLCKEIERQMQKVLHQISTIIAYNDLK